MFSCQARLLSVALTIAIVAPIFAARAQTSPAGHDTAVRSFHLRAGGGVDVADGRNINSANALVGVDWQPRGSRFSVRTAVNYYRQEFAAPCSNPGVQCLRSFAAQLAGVSLDGRFDLMSSRLRPYVVSGVSLNRGMRESEWNVTTPEGFTVLRRISMAGALHSGLGLSFQAGRSQLFTEFRYQMVTNEFGTKKPMTLGIRF